MGQTEDRYHEHDAKRDGHVQGLYGEPKSINPYKPGTGTFIAWLEGWETGHQGHLRMKRRRVRTL